MLLQKLDETMGKIREIQIATGNGQAAEESFSAQTSQWREKEKQLINQNREAIADTTLQKKKVSFFSVLGHTYPLLINK